MSWLSFLNPIANLGSTYLEGKNQVARAKSAADIISIKAAADVKVAGAKAAHKLADNGQTQDFNLDLVAMQQMDKSFLDEFTDKLKVFADILVGETSPIPTLPK